MWGRKKEWEEYIPFDCPQCGHITLSKKAVVVKSQSKEGYSYATYESGRYCFVCGGEFYQYADLTWRPSGAKKEAKKKKKRTYR